jgi:hypothetical protein
MAVTSSEKRSAFRQQNGKPTKREGKDTCTPEDEEEEIRRRRKLTRVPMGAT